MPGRTQATQTQQAPTVDLPPFARATQRGNAGNAARQQDLRAQGALQAPVDELMLDRVGAMVLRVVPEELAEYAATAVPAILRSAAFADMRDGNQVAYMLATAEHESRFGKPKYARSQSLVEDHNPYSHQTVQHRARRGQPARTEEVWSATPHTGDQRRVKAGSEQELDTRYWDRAYGGRLGNRRGTDDAARFRGRGYAQITGRVNYEGRGADLTAQGAFYHHNGQIIGGQGGPRPIDLAANPEHVNESPELAAELLVRGSRDGSYTGRSIGDYIEPGQAPDFVNARRVINGDVQENGASIAAKARRYAAVLATAWPTVFRNREGGPR